MGFEQKNSLFLPKPAQFKATTIDLSSLNRWMIALFVQLPAKFCLFTQASFQEWTLPGCRGRRICPFVSLFSIR